MPNSEISEYITFKRTNGEILKVNQKYVGIRARPDGTMAIHYKAPMEDTIEMEKFFDKFTNIEKLKMDIGDTGVFGVNYRGLIEGKDKNLPEDYEYKILMVQEFKCPKKEEYKNMKKSSEFRNRLAKSNAEN